MRLTLHTDYALRMLIQISLAGDRRVTIREVADAYGISRNHLMKVASQLQHLGYLETVRGKGGGLRLSLPAEDIRLGQLVRDLEPDFQIAECFSPDNACVITPHCRLKGILNNALAAFLDVLDGFSLADLGQPAGRAAELRSLLQIRQQNPA